MKKVLHHPLVKPLLLACVLRILFVLVSHHVYYPDEIYQSLEQSFRIIHGYGIVPWDITYGLRSYVFPFLLTLPMRLAEMIGITNLSVYQLFPQILLILCSLSIPAAGYQLILRLTKQSSAAEVAAYALATWYELIYLSGRALTENISLYCLACAIIVLLRKKPFLTTASALITASFFFRPQFFPVIFVTSLLFLPYLKQYPKIATGALISICIFGGVDWWITGSFLSHIVRNITLSFNSGISQLFGDQPWYFYLISSTITSMGLWIVAATQITKRQTRMIGVGMLGVLLIHSVIPHKEYRFTIILIPLWISLFSLFVSQIKIAIYRHYILTIFFIISCLGMLRLLPAEKMVYGQPLLFSDPVFTIYSTLSQQPIRCGVYDTTRNWVYIPGYYSLHQPVPLYSIDNPPPGSASADYFILPRTPLVPSGFSQILVTEPYQLEVRGQTVSLPGYMVVKRLGPCIKNNQYTYNRSFPAVDSILQSVHAVPIVH